MAGIIPPATTGIGKTGALLGGGMSLPIPSISAASAARSGGYAPVSNTFRTGDFVAGSSSKNNNIIVYVLIGFLALMVLRKAK